MLKQDVVNAHAQALQFLFSHSLLHCDLYIVAWTIVLFEYSALISVGWNTAFSI